MYRLPFELTDSAKLLHFTILGGSADPPVPLNDATAHLDFGGNSLPLPFRGPAAKRTFVHFTHKFALL